MRSARTCHQTVDPAEIGRHLDRGYRILDPHLHTAKSPDVIPAPNVQPRALFERMRAGGWSFITFTDHDLVTAYAELPADDAHLVRGVEIKIRPRRVGMHTRTHTLHVNVYRLSDRQFVDLEAIAATGDLDGFLDYLRSARLPHVLNHPFWHQVDETPNWDFVITLLRDRYFEVTEYNWGRIPELNMQTLEMARCLDVAVWGGSDNHEGKPEYTTLVRGDSFDEAWENVRAGQAILVQQHIEVAGRRVLMKDQADYRVYVMDCLARGAEQLMHVGSRALREKPVHYETRTFWRDLFVAVTTSGRLNRVIPMAWTIGKFMRSSGDFFRRELAKPYVRQQVHDIPALEEAVARLEMLVNENGGKETAALTVP